MNDEREALKLENRRLVVENNQLHQEALRNGELWKRKDFEHDELVKQLKKQLHEALSINNVISHQRSALEQEYNNLKRRWDHFLSSENRNLTSRDEQMNDEKRLKKQSAVISSALEPSSFVEEVSPQKIQEIADLSEILRMKTEDLDNKLLSIKSERERIAFLEKQVEARDQEVKRLTEMVEESGGRTVDVINSDHLHTSNMETIEHLKEEITFLQNQLEAAHSFKMEYDDLKNAKSDRVTLERRVRELEKKNQDLTIEMNDLQRSIVLSKRNTSQSEDKLRTNDERLKFAEKKLAQRDDEIEQLKVLLIELDRTRWTLEEDLRAYQQETVFSNQKANDAYKTQEELHRKLAEKQERIETLQKSIAQLDSKVDELTVQLDEADIKIAKLTESSSTSDHQNELMRRELNDCQIKIEKQLQVLQENERQIKSYKQQLADVTSENNTIKQENKLNKQEMHNVSDDLTQLRQENQYLHGQNTKLNEEIEKLTRQLEGRMGDIIHFKQSLGAKEEEVNDILENYKSLNAEYTRARDAIQMLEHECGESRIQLTLKVEEEHLMKVRVAELEEENHRLLFELKSVQHQIDTLSKQNVTLSEHIRVVEAEKEQILKDLSNSKQMNIEAEKRRNEARNELLQVKIDVEHMNSQLRELQTQKSKIETQFRQDQAKLFDLEKVNEELNVQLLCATTAERDTKNEFQQLQTRISELENKNKVISEQLKNNLVLQSHITEKQQQYDSLLKRVKELSLQHEEEGRIIANQNKEIDTLKQNLRRTEEQLDRALSEMKNLKSIRESDEQDIRTLKEENRSLKSKNHALLNDNQRLQGLLA